MELLNTIEINPFDYSIRDYEYPVGKVISDKDRNDFWLKCLSDRGLQNLKAIKKGSYLVDVKTIEESELEQIIRKQLEQSENSLEYLRTLNGGIVIREKGKIILGPTCCVDIGNISDWEDIFETNIDSWEQLWIGHPWVYTKRSNEMIAFSDYTESNLDTLETIKVILEIPEEKLKTELSRIKKELLDFEKMLIKILNKMNVKRADKIAKIISGNSY